jgi:hypothetical protein
MQMKQVLSEQDREHLFSSWHITQIKTRKKALSLRLWDPAVNCSSPVPAPRPAVPILSLCLADDLVLLRKLDLSVC